MRTRRIWLTAVAVTAGIAGVLTLQGVVGTDGLDPESENGGRSSGPVVSTVRTPALEVSGAEAAYKDEDTGPFSMLAVSWADPSRTVDGVIKVRAHSRKTGEWGRWLTLGSEGEAASDGAARPGLRGVSEPAWTGPSDGVEVRVEGHGSAALPKGLRVDLVDPGSSRAVRAEPAAYAVGSTEEETATPTAPAPEPSESATAPEPTPAGTPTADGPAPSASTTSPEPSATTSEPAPATPSPSVSTTPPPAAPVSTVPRPPIVTRAEWGADETMNDEAPTYGTEVKVAFVHHTAQNNDYSCADSAAIMRGLHTLHVKTNGWKDLGYNFIVDKCGTVFEGRKGGVDLPVVGAQTYGFNTDTTGIAVIGSYTDVDAPAAAKTAVARVAAWKLGQYKYDPAGSTTVKAVINNGKYTAGTDVTFQRISGHRDGFATECPGTTLYGQLPALRTWAAGPVAGLAVSSVSGAGKSGSTYYTKGAVTVRWTATTPAALIAKYELLVDGTPVASTGGTAGSASATLAPGSHQVRVRATHQSGRTSDSAAVTVVAETTPPTFPVQPSLALRAGTVEPTAVPVTLSWRAADTAALKNVKLTAPVQVTYLPTTLSSAKTAAPGVTTAFTMTAYDQAGNTATASGTAAPAVVQETAAVRSGTWAARSSSSYLGGGSLSTSSANASLSWTFTGRSVAWVVSRASGSGQAYVYLDGTKVATVDLKSDTVKYRDAIFTKSWTTAGTHTLKVVNAGTAGRPTVTTDGVVHLK
ncbi:N-acetylmuramoyl-L-alanine amidase [Streptomyces sp. NPDC101118]|uniref:N-acetylmuramoyl-L-alanine amidase n=1 Tax=Streptomyces sp. NPDC101118 TaxID=3366109 RepID=UPI00380DE0DB